MGNHRADVTNDSPRSVTPSPGASTSNGYVGKRRAAPATDSPASRPAPRATGSTSYVGKRRAAPAPAAATPNPPAISETPEEPVAKTRPDRVVLEQTGAQPIVEAPRALSSTDGRISTGELRALVEGDTGSSPFPATFPTSPPQPKPAARPIVPVQRRASQVDPVLADLLSSMGIDPDKVTPDVLDDLGVGGMTTSELTKFLTQPTKAAPMKRATSRSTSPQTPPRGIPAAPEAAAPEAARPEPAAPVAPVVPEPTFKAPEPTHTPKPLRMANTFAPLTGKLRAVRQPRQAPAPTYPAPAPAAQEPRGFQEAYDAPPSSFQIDTTSFPAPPVSLPQQIDFDSMAIDLPAETYAAEVPYYTEPQAEAPYQGYEDGYAQRQPESYFRAETGSIDLPSISEIATYGSDLHDLPAVETTGTMVGIGGPTKPRTRRVNATPSGGSRPTVPMTAGAAALAAAIGGIALTGGPTMVAADDVRLVGATALGGDSDMVAVGDRSATVTRNDERSQTDTAASDREKALQGIDVQADKQDKFLKSNMWELPIPTGVYHITGTFGSSGANWSSTHTGLDFAAPYGTPIHAIARGTVTETAWGGAYGNRTIITLEDGTEMWYCHQSDYGVSVGQSVSPGEVIGYVGSTGNSTGDHLHVEVRPGGGDAVDPDAALNEHGVDPS
ncbi:peptidase M23-like protein [Nocardioides albertanoniae]|uniref:Peptidase M23-like protein n=1 Tax=Nocardioides albertanoniae TaxID=1175486 RepID=A0A543AC36_9ACTN|nr:M23 family metallopeptidase [Nocardioides albertanoniae]TQL70163.1 peptidase M23-like protein [Nocardioides albertanoniae]